MFNRILTIHYKGYLIKRLNFGLFQWRLKSFETEKQALDAIDKHTKACPYDNVATDTNVFGDLTIQNKTKQ